MEPRIGQMVHYKSHGSPNGQFKPSNRAAVVTRVLSKEVVGIAVLSPNGMYFIDEATMGNDPGNWNWIM